MFTKAPVAFRLHLPRQHDIGDGLRNLPRQHNVGDVYKVRTEGINVMAAMPLAIEASDYVSGI